MHGDAANIYRQLCAATPVALDKLPERRGIYALYDHEGQMRYIGSAKTSFRDRIHNRHVAGDGNSHKFSTVYNAGRMWHTRKIAVSDPTDGKIAKELRNQFARHHCRAAYIELPTFSAAEITQKEKLVIALATPEQTRWNDARVLPTMCPEALVEDLVSSLGWPPNKIAAIARQNERWSKLSSQQIA